MIRRPPRSTLFPTRRSSDLVAHLDVMVFLVIEQRLQRGDGFFPRLVLDAIDRKSTRLNSSHGYISYAVFCLKNKNKATGDNRQFNDVMFHGYDDAYVSLRCA